MKYYVHYLIIFLILEPRPEPFDEVKSRRRPGHAGYEPGPVDVGPVPGPFPAPAIPQDPFHSYDGFEAGYVSNNFGDLQQYYNFAPDMLLLPEWSGSSESRQRLKN